MKRTSLAIKNLADRPSRTIVSAIGIGFAILLIFMQLGFMGAVGATATNVYSRLDGDLVIRSPEYLHAYDPRSISANLRHIVSSLPGVRQVRTLDLGVTRWRNPESGEFRAVAMMGIDPDFSAIRLPELGRLGKLLYRDEYALVDDATRADFGPRNGERFGQPDVGNQTEVTGKKIVIAGTFRMGTGLAANGAILLGQAGFNRIAPDRLTLGPNDRRVSLLVVRLDQDADPETAAKSIQRRLRQLGGAQSSAEVLTLDQAIAAERWHWYVRTPVGVIFGVGVVLAVIVGGVICYMVLASDVIARLPEYATLKAIGYSNAYLARVLLGQAAMLASAAFLPALLASFGLYWITSRLAGITIEMTSLRIVIVAALSALMCMFAGWVAIRKMNKAEPANLF